MYDKPRFAASIKTQAPAADSPYAEFLAFDPFVPSGPEAVAGALRSITVQYVSGPACSIGLVRSVAAGTPTDPQDVTKAVVGQPFNLVDTLISGNGFFGIVVDWSSLPVIDPIFPLAYLTLAELPNVPGAELVWEFDEWNPLVVQAPDSAATIGKPQDSIVLWNFGAAAGAIVNVTADWEQG